MILSINFLLGRKAVRFYRNLLSLDNMRIIPQSFGFVKRVFEKNSEFGMINPERGVRYRAASSGEEG